MAAQLDLLGCRSRSELHFHRNILNDTYPQSIGGGIGQSRLCMFLLQKHHIAEVQSSVWPEGIVARYNEEISQGVYVL